MALILGFVMAIAGFILLVMGGFHWPGRTQISNTSARLAGTFLLAFFPLVFAARPLLAQFEQIDHFIVNWVLLVVCMISGCGLLVGALSKTQPLRQAKKPLAAPAPAPRAGRGKMSPRPAVEPKAPETADDFSPPKPAKPKGSVESQNPFDFS